MEVGSAPRVRGPIPPRDGDPSPRIGWIGAAALAAVAASACGSKDDDKAYDPVAYAAVNRFRLDEGDLPPGILSEGG